MNLEGASEEDKRRLVVFSRRAKDLLSSSIFTQGESDNLSLKVNLVPNKGLQFFPNLPDETEIVELFMRFRPFLLKTERSHFYSVCSTLWQLSDDLEQESIKEARTIYKAAMQATGFSKVIFSGSPRITLHSEELIDLWFNADYFHSDLEKEKSLEQFNEVLSQDFTKHAVVISILRAGHAIAILLGLINKINSDK